MRNSAKTENITLIHRDPNESRNDWSIGDCCAYPLDDQAWYRGIIRFIQSDEHVLVFNIDRGDLTTVKMSFLRILKVFVVNSYR